jgi:RNA polymerase sigma factor (TIGR02999 family)
MESPPQTREEAVGDVSRLLRAWSEGDQRALTKLTPIIYEELFLVACSDRQRERSGHHFPITFLVHEAYMCLVEHKRMRWQDRASFFAVSAQLVRRIVMDQTRRHNLQRSAGASSISADEAAVLQQHYANVIRFDGALNQLALFYARKAQVVEMRLFGGLSFEEIAEVLKVSRINAMFEWSTGKVWFYCAKLGAQERCP